MNSKVPSTPKRPRCFQSDFCVLACIETPTSLITFVSPALPLSHGTILSVGFQSWNPLIIQTTRVRPRQRLSVLAALPNRDAQLPQTKLHPRHTALSSAIPTIPLLPPASGTHAQSTPTSPHDDEAEPTVVVDTANRKKLSAATRHKISISMLGHRKSEEMRAKVSEKLKGRIPWNKGKKLSPEIRARMSTAHTGRTAWNKGRPLSFSHRANISQGGRENPRTLSDETRKRMRMARRRPGDAVLAGSLGRASDTIGSYSLLDGADINAYISLRRELTSWSDSYRKNLGKRPTLADIRRVAPVAVVRKFERYMAMREKIRGLAGDVYGKVDPNEVPTVSSKAINYSKVNNNSGTTIYVTKHGNNRMVASSSPSEAEQDGVIKGGIGDMWDEYDRPSSREHHPNSDAETTSLIGTHEIGVKTKDKRLSPNDYRKIGRYRLMETMDINRFTELRRDLQGWSDSFKKKHDRRPTLSDVKSRGKAWLYNQFCEYLDMRNKMSGLMQEVLGAEVDDVEVLEKVNVEGREALEALQVCSTEDKNSESVSVETEAVQEMQKA